MIDFKLLQILNFSQKVNGKKIDIQTGKRRGKQRIHMRLGNLEKTQRL